MAMRRRGSRLAGLALLAAAAAVAGAGGPGGGGPPPTPRARVRFPAEEAVQSEPRLPVERPKGQRMRGESERLRGR